MTMRLLSFQHGDSVRLGAVIDDEYLVDLTRAYRHLITERYPLRAAHVANCFLPGNMVAFLEGGDESMQAAREAFQWAASQRSGETENDLKAKGILRAFAQVRLLPPVPFPGKIFCIGKNYADHAAELGGAVLTTPEIFTRFPSTLIPAGAPIVKPLETDLWDYEGELAVVIGKGGRRIPRENALQHVAGYSCFNDVSARDFQTRITQWTAGKNFDGSGPFGPCLVTADEIGDPQDLGISLVLNESVMQQANTKDMVFPVAFLIAHLSEFITLSPGDVIATGTPGGVGMARTPPRYLRDGDHVKVIIEKVGVLENRVVNEPRR